jgi:hypothetical protein
MRAKQQPTKLQPTVANRRGMDSRDDGLRKVLEQTGYRLTLRRVLLGQHPRRQLQRADRVWRVVQLELQGVPKAVVGGSSRHIRKGERVDHVDVEDGTSGRVVLLGWIGVWMDPQRPYCARGPGHLWLRREEGVCYGCRAFGVPEVIGVELLSKLDDTILIRYEAVHYPSQNAPPIAGLAVSFSPRYHSKSSLLALAVTFHGTRGFFLVFPTVIAMRNARDNCKR